MTPKFSVGEVVILQSVSCPQWNGEYSVLMVIPYGTSYECPFFGTSCDNDDSYGYGYILDDPRLHDVVHGLQCSISWAEHALRKKHQPGELSYTELLESLTVKSGAPA